MKINKIISLFLVISALLICMSVVSANETTQANMQYEVQQTSETSLNPVTTDNDVKMEINKNTDYKTVKTGISDINKSSIKNIANNIKDLTNKTNINKTQLNNIANNIKDLTNITKINIPNIKNIGNISAYSGQNFSFSTKIPTIKNYTVNLPTAVLKIDGKTISKSNVINGVATFNFTVPSLKEGKHTMTIKMGGTKYFSEFEKNITLNIFKRNVTIKTDKMTSFAGKNVTVKAYVKSGNINVPFDKAVLKIAGKTVAKSCVVNGIATFKFTTPDLKEGTYDMVIKTAPNTLFNAASVNQKFSVYRNNLTIKADNLTSLAGKKASLKATFYSDGVKNINNIPAVLKINGTTVAKSTINDGVAIFYFTVPTIKKGNYDLFVKVGDSTYYNTANITNKLTVYAQNVTITTNTVKGYAGDKTDLVANFVSSDQKKVNITKTVLKINGKTLDNKSVVNGVAKYSFTIPNLKAGNYNLTIKSGDTTLYNSAIKTTKLTVIETQKS